MYIEKLYTITMEYHFAGSMCPNEAGLAGQNINANVFTVNIEHNDTPKHIMVHSVSRISRLLFRSKFGIYRTKKLDNHVKKRFLNTKN